MYMLFRDYQTSTTDINAWWDLSGEPCPVAQQQWSIERVDGTVYQDFIPLEGKASYVCIVYMMNISENIEAEIDQYFIIGIQSLNHLYSTDIGKWTSLLAFSFAS